jgi:hypothetical protein
MCLPIISYDPCAPVVEIGPANGLCALEEHGMPWLKARKHFEPHREGDSFCRPRPLLTGKEIGEVIKCTPIMQKSVASKGVFAPKS